MQLAMFREALTNSLSVRGCCSFLAHHCFNHSWRNGSYLVAQCVSELGGVAIILVGAGYLLVVDTVQ